MNEKGFKIGMVITSVQLMQQFEKIASENHLNIHKSYKGMNDAIDVGKEMEAARVEVIISRGGVANLLQKNMTIPVITLPQSSIDIVKNLKKATKLSKKIIMMSFKNRIVGLDILEELLDIDIFHGVYTDMASLENVIVSAKSQGYDVIIGGGTTNKFAEKYHLKFIDFEFNEEILIETLENAISAARSRRKEYENATHYQCVIDATTEGIVGVDNNGCIKTINQVATELFGIESKEIIGRPISDFVSNHSLIRLLRSKGKVHNRLEELNDELYVFNHLPILMNNKDIIGSVTTFKGSADVISAENVVRNTLSKGMSTKYSFKDIIYRSPVMKELVVKAKQFSKTGSTILITGDTGTGKEILAQSIHTYSSRSKQPFVSVHCGALPEQLLESELFGYEEGAFTGSRKGGKPGRFELAHRGTIFLDELDTTPFNVQTRLLRVLQEKEVYRLGGDRSIPIDIRIIAAAGKDLGFAVQEGKFREDLFFRLNVLHIHIPRLFDRIEDIPVILKQFVKTFSEKYKTGSLLLPKLFVRKLMKYSWPGNIRQLRNFAERLVLGCVLHGNNHVFDELYNELIHYPVEQNNQAHMNPAFPLKQQIREKKKKHNIIKIEEALEKSGYSMSKTAKELGISRTTLWRRLNE
jgi:transcriptional regulator with PAS, ATPase and Fis domain